MIIEEETQPAVDQDLVLNIDDWRLTGDGKIHERSFGSMHDISHAGRLGNILTLNGQFEQDIAVLAGQRLRLRVINTANARIMGLICEGHYSTGHFSREVSWMGKWWKPRKPKTILLQRLMARCMYRTRPSQKKLWIRKKLPWPKSLKRQKRMVHKMI